MSALSRRSFLQLAGTAAAGGLALAASWAAEGSRRPPARRSLRVRSARGARGTKSQENFCSRARFASAADALRAAAARGLTGEITWASDGI